MEFQIVGQIGNVETIAKGNSIREIAALRAKYGLGNWRKMKGVAHVRLPDGATALAEVHCYEARGIGKVKLKIKEWL